MPKSTFPHLQLDYYNLYVTCQSCNEPKGNFLVPPYIFDERFAPQTTSTKEYPKPIYGLEDGKCSTFVSQAKDTRLKKISATHYHAYLLQNTLDLLHQNRYDPTIDANHIGGSSLLVLRAAVWTTLSPYLKSLSKGDLKKKYSNLKKEIEAGNYPEFVSLVVYVYELALHKQLSHTYPSFK